MLLHSESDKPVSVIEWIFQKMEDRYGKLWVDRYGEFPRARVISTWAEDLGDMTKAEISKGLSACRDKYFPPTLPEFRALCRPNIDPRAAFDEAAKQTALRDSGRDVWSHPAIFWAAFAVGGYDVRHAIWDNIKTRWTAALEKELAKGQWPDIPPRREALPQPPFERNSEVVLKAKDEIERMFNRMKV